MARRGAKFRRTAYVAVTFDETAMPDVTGSGTVSPDGLFTERGLAEYLDVVLKAWHTSAAVREPWVTNIEVVLLPDGGVEAK